MESMKQIFPYRLMHTIPLVIYCRGPNYSDQFMSIRLRTFLIAFAN